MKISNNLLGLVNIFTFLVSIPIVYIAIIANKPENAGECMDVFKKPFLIMAVFTMAMSIVGIIGGCCRVYWMLWIYLLVMFLLLLAYFSVWIFAFFVTWKPGGGTTIPCTEHKEYKLNRYTEWMQHRVQDRQNWNKIKQCLIEGNLCTLMAPDNATSVHDFMKEELPPVMSSCCMPSHECGFSYENPSIWKKHNNASDSNPDCKSWGNDGVVKCFNCESCKAGMLEELLLTWKSAQLARTIMLGLLCLVYAVGCCAFKNTRKKKSEFTNYGGNGNLDDNHL